MPKTPARPRQTTKRKPAATQRRGNLPFEKSAGAVIFHPGTPPQFLLIYSTYWEFPKGRVDPNESERDAAIREVREETGLDVQLVEGFREEVNYFYRQRNTGLLVKKQVVYFLGHAKTQTVKLSKEHHHSQWLAFDAALAQLKYPSVRNLLVKANDFLCTRQDQ